MPRPCLALLAAAALGLAGPLPAGEAGPEVRAGGRLLRATEGPVDLIGDLWADLPLLDLGGGTSFFALGSRLTMQNPEENFTFRVQDLQYGARAGWRRRVGGRGELSGFFGARGREQVEAGGGASLYQLGVGYSVPGWALRAGPVLDEHAVEADWIVAGEARVRLARWRRARLGLDLDLDTLVEEGEWQAEIAAGPRVQFPLGSGIEATLQARYSRGRNPLGLEGDRWLVGFSYERTGEPEPAPVVEAPALDGRIAAGAGEGRESGQLALRLRSPELLRTARLLFTVDANLLTGADADDLFYRYRLGLELPSPPGSFTLDFYHRSNHRLAASGDRVTSFNVVEVGFETGGWSRPSAWGARPRHGLDGAAHAGYLLDGSFGTERRWHVRGGLRWLPHPSLPLYLRAEAEEGEVRNHGFALGSSVVRALDLELGYRRDDQSFSEDESTYLVSASYGF